MKFPFLIWEIYNINLFSKKIIKNNKRNIDYKKNKNINHQKLKNYLKIFLKIANGKSKNKKKYFNNNDNDNNLKLKCLKII